MFDQQNSVSTQAGLHLSRFLFSELSLTINPLLLLSIKLFLIFVPTLCLLAGSVSVSAQRFIFFSMAVDRFHIADELSLCEMHFHSQGQGG